MRARIRGALTNLSLPTPWPGDPGARRAFLVVLVLGAVMLLVPRPWGWTGNYLFAEDGQVFLTQTLQHWWGTLFQTYAGYLHLVPRLLSLGCAGLAGPDGYAVCVDVGSVLVKALVAVVAFPVLAAYARSWRWGVLAAATVLFLPTGQQEVLGNLTNLRWFLLVGAFFAVIALFQNGRLAWSAATLALLAALSDPMPMLLAPIALWRLVSARHNRSGWSERLPSLALLLGVAIHLVNVNLTERNAVGRGTLADLFDVPSQTIANLLVRGPLATQVGMTLTQDLLRVSVPFALAALVVSAALVFVAWRARREAPLTVAMATTLALFGMAFLFVTFAFPASYIALPDIWSPSQPARYATLAGLFLTPAAVLLMSVAWHSARHPRVARIVVAAMTTSLALAYLGDFGGDARHSSGDTWAELVTEARTQCGQGIDPAVVHNVPAYEGWTTRIACDWLG